MLKTKHNMKNCNYHCRSGYLNPRKYEALKIRKLKPNIHELIAHNVTTAITTKQFKQTKKKFKIC